MNLVITTKHNTFNVICDSYDFNKKHLVINNANINDLSNTHYKCMLIKLVDILSLCDI